MNEAKKKKRITYVTGSLAFLAPVILMLAIFIGNNIFPFGERSFLFSDMYHQYMPFFQELMNKIKAGEQIRYSWNVGMGSNFLALYIYYLASPFNWLAFLLPSKYLIEFMSYAVVFKIGLAGFTAWLYLKHRGKGRPNAEFMALLCAIFYAMSGFVAAYNWNVMWMDCVVLFPLILLGLERLVHEGKTGLYVFSLGLCIFSNFYISIMICLFLVLYFIYLFLAEKHSFSMIWKFALGSLLAGALAAIFLVPEVSALMATDFGDMDFPKEWKSYFPILDVIARHCMAIYTERALEHWPNIYSGCFAFLLVPLYAVNDKIPARKRFGFFSLAGIFLVSFATNGLDFIWHGMNYPDSLPARQSFLYILLIVTMCYETLTHLDGIKASSVIKAYLGAAVGFLCIEKFVEVTDFQTWTWLLNLGFVTIYAACLYVGMVHKKFVARWIVTVLIFVAALSESAINMAYTSVGTTSRTAYLSHVTDYKTLYERNKVSENGFSRFEKFTRKTKNDATLAGFPSASVFSSTMNSYVMDFYTRIGLQHSKVYYGYDGATAFSAALLNVGYVFGESDEWENELYRLKDEENGIYLYEAAMTLPFGYVAPKGFDVPEEMKDKGVTLQNELVNQLGIDGIMLRKIKSQQNGDDVEFTAKEDGIYYACVTAYGTSKVKVTGGTPEEMNFKDLKKDVMFYLGHLDEGQSITFTNGDSSDDTPKISINVYKFNMEMCREALEILKEQHMTNVSVDDCHVSGKLNLSKAGRLILSVPYEKGWTVLVNGAETEPEIFGEAFIALDLEPGEYDIALSYDPAGRKLGVLITLLSLLVTAIVFLGIPLGKKAAGKRKAKAEEAEETSKEKADEKTEESTPKKGGESTKEATPEKTEEKTEEKKKETPGELAENLEDPAEDGALEETRGKTEENLEA